MARKMRAFSLRAIHIRVRFSMSAFPAAKTPVTKRPTLPSTLALLVADADEVWGGTNDLGAEVLWISPPLRSDELAVKELGWEVWSGQWVQWRWRWEADYDF